MIIRDPMCELYQILTKHTIRSSITHLFFLPVITIANRSVWALINPT